VSSRRVVLDLRQPEPPLLALLVLLDSHGTLSGHVLPFLTWREKPASACVCVVAAAVPRALLHSFYVAAPTICFTS